MDRYSEYKDSGIEWIGEIPGHWSINRLANFCTFSKGKSISKRELTSKGFPCILYSEIYTKFERAFESVTSYVDDSKALAAVKINRGAFLFTCSGETREDIGKCVLYLGSVEIAVGGDCVIAKLSTPQNYSLEFLSYVFNANYVNFCKESNSRGDIIVHIYTRQIREIVVALPPTKEQICIACFLTKKTARIDSLIEKLQKKIELLKEYRTALIRRCVTKGLDPNVKMKDSKIEWIGEIPKEWRCSRLKNFFDTYFGGTWGSQPTENQTNGLVNVIRVTDFEFSKLRVSSNIPTKRSLNLSLFDNKLVRFGDLILEKSGGGEKKPVGRSVLVDFEPDTPTVNSNFTNLMRANREIIEPRYLIYVFYHMYVCGRTVINIKQTTGIQNLDVKSFLDETFFQPTLEEQHRIASFLDQKTSRIDSLIEKLQRKIELLKEYRQSLISKVITGKVRVPEIAK